MLKSLKIGLLEFAETLGAARAILNSGWRMRRLLILGYHSFSRGDEHLWNPQLFVSPEFFRRRLEILRSMECNLLALDDALERLRSATLPPRSVVLTVDDGTPDFVDVALPMLEQFGFPVTLYLTTYYCRFQRPVFDVMLSYLLWRGRGSRLVCPELGTDSLALDDAGRLAVWQALQSYATRERFSAVARDALLQSIAARLGIDYADLCRRRVLHLMAPDELARIRAAGVDVQLHTHRHRSPREEAAFLREIEENRTAIQTIAPGPPDSLCHFCFPNGDHFPDAASWLARAGIRSAVACEPGLATRDSPPLLLPRVIDHMGLSEVEFRAWVSGCGAFLPHRPMTPARP